MTVDLERLEALARAATRGKWTAKPYGRIVAGPEREYTNGSAQSQIAMFCTTAHEQDEDGVNLQQENTEFAAEACPDTVIQLLALIQTMAKQVAASNVLLKRAAEQVKGLLNERNNLIIERNDALVRAIKAEYRPAVRTRAGDHEAVPAPVNEHVLDFEYQPKIPLQWPVNIKWAGPNDPMPSSLPPLPTDVFTLRLPHLPESLDLPDSEGGNHD